MKIIIDICRTVLNLIYFLMKLRPQKKKVVFLSRQSDNPSLDIIEIRKEIYNQRPEYDTVALCKRIGSGLSGKIAYCFHILKQMWHLSDAEIAILDSYCISVSLLTHRKSLLVIQIWHSVGTMKKFGYSILDRPEGSSSKLAHAMRMHENYDYIFCAGEGYKSHLAEGFRYPENKIAVFPLPRVQILQDKDYKDKTRRRIFAAYPHLSDKKNIVYVPTFRKNSDEKKEFLKAVENLKASFTPYEDKFNLIIKPHPLSGAKDEYNRFSSFDFLFVADYIISDYSCIMYYGAILHVPLFFYTYDFENYVSTRDIYIDYKKEIPGTMYDNSEDLVNAINNDNFDMEKQEAFLKKYVNWDMPDIIPSTVDFIFRHRKA